MVQALASVPPRSPDFGQYREGFIPVQQGRQRLGLLPNIGRGAAQVLKILCRLARNDDHAPPGGEHRYGLLQMALRKYQRDQLEDTGIPRALTDQAVQRVACALDLVAMHVLHLHEVRSNLTAIDLDFFQERQASAGLGLQLILQCTLDLGFPHLALTALDQSRQWASAIAAAGQPGRA